MTQKQTATNKDIQTFEHNKLLKAMYVKYTDGSITVSTDEEMNKIIEMFAFLRQRLDALSDISCQTNNEVVSVMWLIRNEFKESFHQKQYGKIRKR